MVIAAGNDGEREEETVTIDKVRWYSSSTVVIL
jgi:hypothetical protein